MQNPDSSQYDKVVQAPLLGGEPSLEGSLESAPIQPRAVFVEPRSLRQKLKPYLFGLCGLLLLTGTGYVFLQRNQRPSLISTGDFSTVKLPLDKISNTGSTQNTAKSLDVNGQLHVSEAIVLSPVTKPTIAATGQLLFDKSLGGLTYYNGTQFIPVGGSSTTLVTNNSITNLTNLTNVTNVTNVSGGGINAPSGTTGSIAMFTGANTLGDSLINQSGSTLNVGAVLGAATTNVQGGTGGLGLVTGDVIGTSGAITLQSGASSTTAAGDITIDTGPSIVTGTIVGNKTFETGTDAMALAFGFNDTIVSSSAQAHSGTKSLSITVGTNGAFSSREGTPYSIPAVAGHTYRFSAWVRAGSTPNNIGFYTDFSSTGFSGGGSTGNTMWGIVTDNSSGWTQVSGNLVAPASTNKIGIWIVSDPAPAGEVHYIDDIVVTDLSSSLFTADIKIGAANAQTVTIGNVNETGPTNIYGAGLTLNGGLGNTTINGGAVNITGSGASTFSASTLTLTSGTAATWGIGNSGGPGGGLTLQAGGAGGNNNGGNIVLQAGFGAGEGAGGDVYIDSQLGSVSGTIVGARDFEASTQNMLATGASVAQNAIVFHSGAFSLGMTASGGNWAVNQDQTTAGAPVVAGRDYYFSAYVRAFAASSAINASITWKGVGTFPLRAVTDVSSGWMHISGRATAPVGATEAFWNFTGTAPAGEIHLIDDLVITDLSTSTAVANINLGATFGQALTLGNLDQVGVTSLQGGSGVDINSAASALNITGGTVTIAGTSNFSQAGGSISITSGSSSTTASGDINIDTGSGIIDGELMSNKTFEGGLDSMSTWYNTVLSATTEQARTGTQSLKVARTSNFWGIGEDQGGTNGTPVVPGHQYYVSAWLRAATSPDTFTLVVLWENGVVASTQSSPITDNTTGWTELSIVATAPAGATKMYIQSSGVGGSAGEVHYWDDITVTDLSSASSASAITLGATNAKFVSIGNINQIGPTSITGGGGINLNAGISNMNMTAGVFNLTGTAASVLSTSAGALTISSGTAATWGIANASTGAGGNLTLKAGDSAAGSDGGDLILQGGAGSGAGIGGSVVIRPREDSAIAFQIQDSTGATPLFTADTTGMSLTVTGTTTKFASLNLVDAHFGISQTNAPTIAAPTSCGTSPSAAVSAASADSAGSFTITTGTGGTSATCDTTLTFNKAFAGAPKSILVVGKANAASAARQVYVVSANATSFTVSFGASAAGANSTTYSFSYWVIE